MTNSIRQFLLVLALFAVAFANANTAQYTYDSSGKLRTVTAPTWTIQYSYDAVGNVTQIIRTTTNGLLVSSFSPTSGVEGTTVTVQGAGFSTAPATNVVKFNGTLAAVSSATATSLVTQVPEGATSGPISVTVGSNTATSQTAFTVTPFPSDLTITSFSAGGVSGNPDGSYSIPVTYTVKNIGQGTAKASWSDRCYVSADTTLDTSDAVIGSVSRSTDLASMASYTVNATCTTTTTIVPGSYTLFVKTDGAAQSGSYSALSAVAESDETNNFVSVAINLPAVDFHLKLTRLFHSNLTHPIVA
jgi:YD repeat-containing protein